MHNFPAKHPYWWLFITLAVGDFPQWFGSVWSLFSTEAAFPTILKWLDVKHLTSAQFSPYWITVPLGLVLFGWLMNELRLQRSATHATLGIQAVCSKHQKPSVSEAGKNGFISLHEATRNAYQDLRTSKSVYADLAEQQAKGKSPEVILDSIATYLRDDVQIWGKPPLCDDLEQITNAGPPFYFMEGGAKSLRKGAQIAFTELSVNESDWKLAVENLKQFKTDTPL